ncbi:hypothetical protein P9G84_10120 [Brevibacillus centrosporus]|uniref:hypothetical protein n=1 Tax=Brevibacillus centrosporus TaxID=54910 RepID=UPI001142BC34|nr:hypothetical protein [Brevibacillus centrosporus]MEC2129323.1 hypothetical protein [Brevibacillus centrosporus]GED33489.1 hypothetical protein BCE02nite_46300 [Brevibacillus centrosporus]
MEKNPVEDKDLESRESELYHSLLISIAERFDPALDTVRTAFYEQHLRSFVLELLVAPFKNVAVLVKSAKAKGILTVATVIGGGYFLTTIDTIKDFVLTHKIGVGLTVFFLWYGVSAFLHFLNMAKLDRKDVFHIVAFRALRKAEYNLFEPFVKQKTQIDMQAVVQWFYKELRNNHLSDELHNVRKERDSYLESLVQLNEELTRTLLKAKEVDNQFLQRTDYLYGIIEGISRNIARISNNLFNIKSLNFIAPFTLYRLEENVLTYVDEDGTSGNSPLSIDITVEANQSYSAVMAVKSPSCFAQADAGPLQSRKIASFFIKLPTGNNYVVNFHMDSANLFFQEDVGRSIINLWSIYEVVEAHCLLMDKLLTDSSLNRKGEIRHEYGPEAK